MVCPRACKGRMHGPTERSPRNRGPVTETSVRPAVRELLREIGMAEMFPGVAEIADQPGHAGSCVALAKGRERAEHLQSIGREIRRESVEESIRRVHLRHQNTRGLLTHPELCIAIARTLNTGDGSRRLGLGPQHV